VCVCVCVCVCIIACYSFALPARHPCPLADRDKGRLLISRREGRDVERREKSVEGKPKRPFRCFARVRPVIPAKVNTVRIALCEIQRIYLPMPLLTSFSSRGLFSRNLIPNIGISTGDDQQIDSNARITRRNSRVRIINIDERILLYTFIYTTWPFNNVRARARRYFSRAGRDLCGRIHGFSL
jgi:hypothetical protein